MTPYLWAPSIRGSIGLGGAVVPLDIGVEQLSGGLKAAAMGYVQWRYRSQFIYVEGLDLRFADQQFAPVYNEAVKVDLFFAEVGYGHHFVENLSFLPKRPLQISPYLGLRYAVLTATVGSPPQSIEARDTWLDLAIGVIGEAPVYAPLSFVVKLDGAGFGLGHDHYWNGMTLFQYRFKPAWSVAAGYRATSFHSDAEGGNAAALDLRGSGPLIALSARF